MDQSIRKQVYLSRRSSDFHLLVFFLYGFAIEFKCCLYGPEHRKQVYLSRTSEFHLLVFLLYVEPTSLQIWYLFAMRHLQKRTLLSTIIKRSNGLSYAKDPRTFFIRTERVRIYTTYYSMIRFLTSFWNHQKDVHYINSKKHSSSEALY